MERIERPKKVSKLDKQILSKKNFEENTDNQLGKIYDKLDELVDKENETPITIETEKIIFEGSAVSPTLTDDVKNFKELIVYYKANRDSQYFYGSKTIPIIDGASKFTLVDIVSTSEKIKGMCATYSVSGTKVTASSANLFEATNGSNISTNTSNSYLITKIKGIY